MRELKQMKAINLAVQREENKSEKKKASKGQEGREMKAPCAMKKCL